MPNRVTDLFSLLQDQLHVTLDVGSIDTRELIVARREAEGVIESGDQQEDLAELNLIVKHIDDIQRAVGEEWGHGAQLVRENCFEDHARELAEDLGVIEDRGPWPLNCIDWEQAAEELRGDYSSVEIAGATYYFRG